MAKVYDNATDIITFARLQSQNTTSGSSYLGSDGLLKFAAEDEPRIEYGSDGSLKGLLIEEQRTNLFNNSNDPNLVDGGGSFLTVSANTEDDPAGSASASLITAQNANSFFGPRFTSGATGQVYTASFIVKNNGSAQSRILVRNSIDAADITVSWDGATLTSTTDTSGSSSTEPLGSNYYRISVTYTATEGTQRPRIYPDTIDGSNSLVVYAWQLEAGSFATSYIPTSGSQVTRSADLASIPVSAFGYNQDAGTIVVEYSTFHTYTGSPYPRVVTLSQVGAASRTSVEILGYAAFTSFEVYNLSASQVSEFVGGGGGDKAAIAFAQDDVQAAKDGSLVGATDTSATIVPYTDIFIGMSTAVGSAHISGHIKSLKYYPRRLTNTQLQELTS